MLHRLHSRAFQFGRRGGTGHPDGAERDLLEGGQPCGRVPRRANEDAIQGGYRQPHVRLGRYSPRYHFRHFAIISIPCQSRGGSLGRGKVRLPLSGRHDLMAQFKEILGWDEAMERSALAKEREELYQPPGRPLTILGRPSREELNIRYGSYRRLPADVRACRLVSLSGHEIGFVVQEVNVECSGRDEMCKSVLNDEWVSHPSFSSEDSVFMAHKKNLYEEALHRTEEERHEYDFHIDALVRTIGVLEPLNHKIMGMSPEERAIFRIKPNFGGAGKAVHQRIIKKIYGREAGLEVLQAMQDTPALALPVVLARLKQKEGEWKRAQREWNKIWRAVDAVNYALAGPSGHHIQDNRQEGTHPKGVRCADRGDHGDADGAPHS
jgi:Sin3 family co-repressor